MTDYLMARQVRHLMAQRDRAYATASSATTRCSEAQYDRNMAQAQLGAALQALELARSDLAALHRALDLAAGPGVRSIAAARMCPPVAVLLEEHDRLSQGACVAGKTCDYCGELGDPIGVREAAARFIEYQKAADRVARMVTLARAAEAVRGDVAP